MTRRVLFRARTAIDARGTRHDAWFLAEDGIIRAAGSRTDGEPEADDLVDLGGARVCPGFVDMHVHGGGGAAFDDGAAAIRTGLAAHRRHGTTRSVVTLATDRVDRLTRRLDAVARLADDDPLVLGTHLEGPYLSATRRGAHPARLLRSPRPEELDALVEAARGSLRQLTLAPELPGGLDAVERLVAAGVVVAVGHTDADAPTVRAAFDRGARVLTHAFNGMRGIHHRAPGPVVAAVEDERVTLELVLDGVHVDPAVGRMLFAAAPGRVAVVSDAMAAAAAPDGRYRVGAARVRVRDGVARLARGDSLAGSTLTLDVALRIAIRRLRLSPEDAIGALTAVPARALGLGDRIGLLGPGHVADFVVLDEDWNVAGVWAAAERIA